MEYLKINGHDFCNMIKHAANNLEEQKEYVNSLNVFPVPDGDTGTNMSMTFKSAVSEVKGLENKSVGEISKKLAKGALMGARGNSGVILSQIFRGIAKGLENKEEATIEDVKESIVQGAVYAYKAVMRPTEGTILTIIRAAAEGTKESTANDIVSLMDEVCLNCKKTLDKTPDMLPQLKQAKVVDAGGMGLLIIFKGMYEALRDGLTVELNDKPTEAKSYQNATVENKVDLGDIKFGYCTEFIILSDKVNTVEFKNELEENGDSIVLVALDDIVKVHIHTNDPGKIISRALQFGELSKIKIDNMREQHRSLMDFEETENNSSQKQEEKVEENKSEKILKKYGFVTVARGEGIKNIFEDLGVDVVIEGGQTMNPSTQDIVESINKVDAENVFVFPNNKNIVMAANQAVDLVEDKNVIVIPTATIPQGITAITMFDADSEPKANSENMIEHIKNVTSGSVTYAIKDTEDNGREIKKGNILGLLEGAISEIGTDIYKVCEDLISSMVKEDSELITIFYGEECEPKEVEDLIEKLEDKYPDMDIQCFDGKQPLYYFITSVE